MGTVKFNGQVRINTTSNSTVKDYLVRFFDFDGTILKQQWVYSGQNATAPIPPAHQYLTFNSWNNAFTNVQNDIDTGAIYDTTDGKSYLFITLTTVTGLNPILYFNKSTTSLLTVNWGDGTSTTGNTSGNFNITHTYSAVGNYIITVDNSLGGNYGFGQNSAANTIFGQSTYISILTKIYCGNFTSGTNRLAFFNSYSINYISLSTSTNIDDQTFQACSLQHINYLKPTTAGTTFNSSPRIKNIIFPNSLTTIGNTVFGGCFGLSELKFGSLLTSIGSSTFSGLNNIVSYMFLSTTPPSIASNTFTGINPICKIYVPDASVNAYKAATNWSTYANYIYPLSTRPKPIII